MTSQHQRNMQYKVHDFWMVSFLWVETVSLLSSLLYFSKCNMKLLETLKLLNILMFNEQNISKIVALNTSCNTAQLSGFVSSNDD